MPRTEPVTDEDVLSYLAEAGRVMSGANLGKLHDAVKGLGDVHSGTCDLGQDCPVSTIYHETVTDAPLDGDFMPLVEKAIGKDGVVPIKVIAPGWGASGYYSRGVLERDGPATFPAGTKMYWNHPTAQEARDRPERDLRDLAAETVSPATFREGPAGPGLYADAKVFGHYAPVLEDLASSIGVSIRASGKATIGEADGKRGQIIERIVPGNNSIDFVTAPGAGGKVLSLFEAARGGAPTPAPRKGEDTTMNEAEIKALQESVTAKDTELKDLREKATAAEASAQRAGEALILREARDLAQTALAKVQLPDVTRARLVETIAANPPVKDGKLDTDAIGKTIEETYKAEVKYLTEATGAGSIRGMGSADGGSGPKDATIEESEKELARAFARIGLNESTAKIAAAGR